REQRVEVLVRADAAGIEQERLVCRQPQPLERTGNLRGAARAEDGIRRLGNDRDTLGTQPAASNDVGARRTGDREHALRAPDDGPQAPAAARPPPAGPALPRRRSRST